jgi:hypothetical protein
VPTHTFGCGYFYFAFAITKTTAFSGAMLTGYLHVFSIRSHQESRELLADKCSEKIWENSE